MKQNNNTENSYQDIEKLQDELDKLKDDIDQSYYRIPKKEFESTTVNKITSEVTELANKKINSIRNWVGAILVTLSFFGITQWNSLVAEVREGITEKIVNIEREMNQSIEKNFNAKLEVLEDRYQKRLNFIELSQQRLKKALDDQLVVMSNDIIHAVDKAVKEETERQLATVRKDIETAQMTVLKTELNSLRADVKSNSLGYDAALIKLDPLLRRSMQLGDQELVTDFLASLFRWNFNQGSYESMDKMRVEYETEYNFKPSTWANIAIADMFLYEEFYSPIYKQRAIDAYTQALIVSPDYGTPQAVRLIIHMIDVERESIGELKEKEKSHLRFPCKK